MQKALPQFVDFARTHVSRAAKQLQPCVLALCAALLVNWVAPERCAAQKSFGGDDMFSGFAAPPLPGQDASKVKFKATYELEEGTDKGRVTVTATIADGWHMYSVTQPTGGPLRTKIALNSKSVEVTGPFGANQSPEISENDVWPGVPIEEHAGTVTWVAPIKLNQPFDPQTETLPIKISGQVCQDACIQVNENAEAKFVGYYASQEKAATSLRTDSTQAVWSAKIEPQQVAAGGSATIKLKAELDAGYHVYEFVPGDESTEFRTNIVATSKAGLKFGEPMTGAETETIMGFEAPVTFYKGTVEWMIPVTVPETAGLGEHPIELQVAFLTCNDRSCSPQSGVKINGVVLVAESNGTQHADMTISEVDFSSVVAQPNLATWIDNAASEQLSESAETQTLAGRLAGDGLQAWMVFAALAGGFILNFMPCVLPVIGLKLMSFVNQSGNSQARVISLNLSYVAGILAVMFVLAAVNIGFKLAGGAFGWGQQFQQLWFQVPLTVLIFAMALSFLGVWEIPIPGFATSSKSGELMEKEGLDGAFYKGILTTILATPCSGPFLGTLFGLTLTLSVTSILLLYMLVGIGLGLPYLALCIYPGFIKLMPKPGAWMETLKQVLAFPLLLTVVYFIAMIQPDYRIATLILLIVVWFACWFVGRIPPYAEARRIRAGWITATAVTALGALIGFSMFGPVQHEIPWVPYSEATLAKYRSEGKTVMVEFTARWCLTCQFNMKNAIDVPNVASLVDENAVVPLLADWSEPSDEILNKLKELDSLSIPLLAIYPADPNAEPIILRDAITESQLLQALKDAGPSQAPTKLTSHID